MHFTGQETGLINACIVFLCLLKLLLLAKSLPHSVHFTGGMNGLIAAWTTFICLYKLLLLAKFLSHSVHFIGSLLTRFLKQIKFQNNYLDRKIMFFMKSKRLFFHNLLELMKHKQA